MEQEQHAWHYCQPKPYATFRMRTKRQANFAKAFYRKGDRADKKAERTLVSCRYLDKLDERKGWVKRPVSIIFRPGFHRMLVNVGESI